MPESYLTWLDFSEAERRKMIEIVALFKERDTRDELGLATIRDSFSDRFFPGTTTLQTRARYFLFVPWLYRHYETTHVPSIKINSRLRQDEIALIDTLQKTGETDGVIGQRSGISLQRFPSSIYWIGLQRWGVCRFPGSQEQYQRSLNQRYVRQSLYREADERSSVEGLFSNWDPDLPLRTTDFPQKADFALTIEEASYLKERLLLSCSESLLSYLVEYTNPIDEMVPFPWLHPQFDEFPHRLRDWLTHARNFSEGLHGAALLYNLRLAEIAKNEKLIEEYRQNLKRWYSELRIRRAAWSTWNRGEFWTLAAHTGVSIPFLSRKFVDEWFDRLFESDRMTRPDKDKYMCTMVEKRELYLKGNRSRFRSKRHLEMWSGALLCWADGFSLANSSSYQ